MKKEPLIALAVELAVIAVVGTISNHRRVRSRAACTSAFAGAASPPGRNGAVCGDGRLTLATGHGACSHHAGVDRWF